jgi:hypothetical protein
VWWREGVIDVGGGCGEVGGVFREIFTKSHHLILTRFHLQSFWQNCGISSTLLPKA